MIDFPSLFPGATVLTLEQNYRSTSPILDTTNKLIALATNRYSKTLFSTRPSGSMPQFVTCKDEDFEARFVVNKVLEHLEQGIGLRKQAVLFRAGSHSAALEIALVKNDIPFHKYGGLKFLEAAHVKDFVSLVRILENPRDEMAWFRVLNLFDGVGPATAAAVFERLGSGGFALDALDSLSLPSPADGHVGSLIELLKGILCNEKLGLSVQLERVAAFTVPCSKRTTKITSRARPTSSISCNWRPPFPRAPSFCLRSYSILRCRPAIWPGRRCAMRIISFCPPFIRQKEANGMRCISFMRPTAACLPTCRQTRPTIWKRNCALRMWP